jgi:hypothetical protein
MVVGDRWLVSSEAAKQRRGPDITSQAIQLSVLASEAAQQS